MDKSLVLLIISLIVFVLSLVLMFFIRGWFMVIPMVASLVYIEVYLENI